jgi:hypothetical protein
MMNPQHCGQLPALSVLSDSDRETTKDLPHCWQRSGLLRSDRDDDRQWLVAQGAGQLEERRTVIEDGRRATAHGATDRVVSTVAGCEIGVFNAAG